MAVSGGNAVEAAPGRNVWAIARELAEAIEASPELEAFRRTEEAVLADEEALALVREYEQCQRALKRAWLLPPDDQRKLRERFRTVEERFRNHPLIQAHVQARAELDRFLERINAVVTFPITGTYAPRTGGCGGCRCGLS